jgi:hypothetical protein
MRAGNTLADGHVLVSRLLNLVVCRLDGDLGGRRAEFWFRMRKGNWMLRMWHTFSGDNVFPFGVHLVVRVCKFEECRVVFCFIDIIKVIKGEKK